MKDPRMSALDEAIAYAERHIANSMRKPEVKKEEVKEPDPEPAKVELSEEDLRDLLSQR